MARIELLPFRDFFGRFASWQAASGISECSVAASPLLEFSLARISNRRISECSVVASGIAVFTAPNIADDVAFAYEPGGLQHSSSHSALILSRSIFVNHFLETVIDTVWQNA